VIFNIKPVNNDEEGVVRSEIKPPDM